MKHPAAYVQLLRWARILFVATLALFFSLVAFGNITPPGINFPFIKHVLDMDTLFSGSELTWRAIHTPALHLAAFCLIVAWQVACAGLLWCGALQMVRARHGSGQAFESAKILALAGLGAGFLLYGAGFLVIGGEWFSMWQSKTWNGQSSAHIFLTFIGLVLIFLVQGEPEIEPMKGKNR